jgi:hypothetical protein
VTRLTSRIARITGLAVFSVFTSVAVHAAPILAATVTPAGTLFHYDYAITFNPADDEIAILTVSLLAGDTLTALTAPAGYAISYDSGLGLLDFLPGLGGTFPLAGTLGGFAFNSPHSAAPTTFEALTTQFDFLTGNTTGPLGPVTPVPEPVAGVLVSIGLAVLGRRRALQRRNPRI